MNVKLGSLSAAVALMLAPVAAFARDGHYRPSAPTGHVAVSVNIPTSPPRGDPSSDGRYELRPVSRFVPGFEERVWVPEQCFEKRKHHHRRRIDCRGGYYETRVSPGHYEQVQEWVWVAYPPRRAPGFEIRLSSSL
jgi:hypothetical protein